MELVNLGTLLGGLAQTLSNEGLLGPQAAAHDQHTLQAVDLFYRHAQAGHAREVAVEGWL